MLDSCACAGAVPLGVDRVLGGFAWLLVSLCDVVAEPCGLVLIELSGAVAEFVFERCERIVADAPVSVDVLLLEPIESVSDLLHPASTAARHVTINAYFFIILFC